MLYPRAKFLSGFAVASNRSIPPIRKTQNESKPSPLQNSILAGQNGERFNEDNLARINYFADDAKRLGYSPSQEEALAQEFNHFHLARHLRNRESRPSDLQLRTFFDDLTLNYVSKGIVPTKEDIEKTYKSVVNEN